MLPTQIGPLLLAVGVPGMALTVTVPLPLLAQPVMPSVTVTVYVVVEAGETVIDAVVAPPGLHR